MLHVWRCHAKEPLRRAQRVGSGVRLLWPCILTHCGWLWPLCGAASRSHGNARVPANPPPKQASRSSKLPLCPHSHSFAPLHSFACSAAVDGRHLLHAGKDVEHHAPKNRAVVHHAGTERVVSNAHPFSLSTCSFMRGLSHLAREPGCHFHLAPQPTSFACCL
jgi:hypothetical protein